jgi:hypothetical protein
MARKIDEAANFVPVQLIPLHGMQAVNSRTYLALLQEADYPIDSDLTVVSIVIHTLVVHKTSTHRQVLPAPPVRGMLTVRVSL